MIKHEEKNKKFVSFVPISMIDAKRLEKPEALLKYCSTTLDLINPTIVRSKLLINTQIKIDGYLFAITGRTGNRITLKNNIPLVLSQESQRTLKKIETFNRKKQLYKNINIDSVHDELNENNTFDLYEELMQKAECTIYSTRPSSQKDVFRDSIAQFIKLPLPERCEIITEVVTYYGMNNGVADLSKIGASKQSGTLLVGAKKAIQDTKISLIDQSITGLFEEIEEIKA